jgi:CRISPR-associated protein Cmr2
LGYEAAEEEIKGGFPDQVASAYERLPMPDAAGRYNELGVAPEGGSLTVVHPLSAERRSIRGGVDEGAVLEALDSLLASDLPPRRKFLTLWRLLPERLAERLGESALLAPAETRCPDHTIWQHLDTTAAMAWAMHGGKGAAALLSFKLSPVQGFIEAARSLRDLLTGSYILSRLTMAALEPVLESCGPTAIVYPALRGIPLMDRWLRQNGVEVEEPPSEALARPSLPHRFLALVPSAIAEELGEKCKDAARRRWLEIAEDVHRSLKSKLDDQFPGWDKLWNEQVNSYFDFRAAVCPFNETLGFRAPGESSLERLAALGKLGRAGDVPPGAWQHAVEISAALMDAGSRVRHIPAYQPPAPAPEKCTLLGTYEQMGPAKLWESRAFWESVQQDPSMGVHKQSDRLCAVSFVKRLAFQEHFIRREGIEWSDVRFPDTEKLARRSGEKFRYYALLMMDGDHMGQWLSGKNKESPRVRDVLHEKILAWHGRDASLREALDLKRPVTPGLHAAISEALNRFATKVVPAVVEESGGVLIYAGGDDVLAALPLKNATGCAHKLRACFSSWEILGSKATSSAGLVLAHYKEDLRGVLNAARSAERQAKAGGRNRIAIAALRRSGEHARAVCLWDYLPVMERQIQSFSEGSSDRWTYILRRQLPELSGLPVKAFRKELERLLKRSEHRDLEFLDDFDRFLELAGNTAPPAQCFADFLTLSQTASFMTRGED